MFGRLHLEPAAMDDGRRTYRLLRPYQWSAHDRGCAVRVIVPADTITDFASVPRWLWSVFPPDGQWAEAAVLHDYLYRTGSCSRFLADALFREAMHELRVPLWRRLVIYYAVRLCGARAYRRINAQKNKQASRQANTQQAG